MAAFLITYKPSHENPSRGWPLGSLQKLVGRFQTEGGAEEPWRFRNKKDVSLGDRVFLLVQGKMGPAIIGYGRIVSSPLKTGTQRLVPIRFEALVDPTHKNFADRTELDKIGHSHHIWNTQSSGIRLPDELARTLEALVVGKTPKPISETPNPNWTRDELIVALDVYLRHRSNLPDKSSMEISNLSHKLNRLGQTLFSSGERGNKFRNVNGVSMKLINFRRLDPESYSTLLRYRMIM